MKIAFGENSSVGVSRGGKFEFKVHSPEILLVDWKTMGIEPLSNQLN
jgi:hypothetical protein